MRKIRHAAPIKGGINLSTARYSLPCRLIYGAGTVSETGRIARSFGRRVMVLTGCRSAQENGFADLLLRGLADAGLDYTVRAGLQGCATLETLAPVARHIGDYEPDVVIAMGGAAVINAAKAAAGLSRSLQGAGEPAAGGVTEPAGMPVIAVPTLPPNGVELSSSALLYTGGASSPKLWRHELLAPRWAVVDFDLIGSAPPALVSLTALDGLVHAVEAFVSTNANEISDALAIDAARRLGSKPALTPVTPSGDAVRQIVSATLMAGMAWELAGLGAAHGLAFALAPAAGKPHGMVSAALLPLIMRFNMPNAHEKYALLSHAWGLAAGGDTVDQAAHGIRHVMNLNRHVGVPMQLHALGLPLESLPGLVQASLASEFMADNPREVKADPLQAVLSEGW